MDKTIKKIKLTLLSKAVQCIEIYQCILAVVLFGGIDKV